MTRIYADFFKMLLAISPQRSALLTESWSVTYPVNFLYNLHVTFIRKFFSYLLHLFQRRGREGR